MQPPIRLDRRVADVAAIGVASASTGVLGAASLVAALVLGVRARLAALIGLKLWRDRLDRRRTADAGIDPTSRASRHAGSAR